MKKKLHYAWIICISCTLLIFQSLGLISNIFSSYLPYIIEEFDITNAQNSSLMTARWVTTFISMLFVNKYYEKFSYRTGMAIATLFTAASHFMYSFAGSYAMCVVSSFVMGLGYGLGSMIPATVLISRWFNKNRQLAMGIATAGSSLAVIFLPRLLTKYIALRSVQAAFRLEGFSLIAIAVILFILVRDNPEDMGLKPFGDGEVVETKKVSALGNSERNDIEKSNWVLLIIAAVCLGAMANPTYSHFTINYTAQGYDKALAATYFSATGFILALAKILCGRIGDKIGGLKTAYIFGTIEMIGFIFVSLAPLHITAINLLAVLGIGLGTPLPTMAISLWSSQLANKKDYPKLVARMQIFYSLGSLAYSNIPGVLADKFDGSYSMAFIISTIITMICLLLSTTVYLRRGQLKEAIKARA